MESNLKSHGNPHNSIWFSKNPFFSSFFVQNYLELLLWETYFRFPSYMRTQARTRPKSAISKIALSTKFWTPKIVNFLIFWWFLWKIALCAKFGNRCLPENCQFCRFFCKKHDVWKAREPPKLPPDGKSCRFRTFCLVSVKNATNKHCGLTTMRFTIYSHNNSLTKTQSWNRLCQPIGIIIALIKSLHFV